MVVFLKDYVCIAVFIMLCYGGDMRALMLYAYDLGMLNGDYAFLTVNLLPSAAIGNNTFMGNDGRDAEAALAFRGILSIHVREPTTDLWGLFTKNVRQKMNDYPFHIQLDDQEKVRFNGGRGEGRKGGQPTGEMKSTPDWGFCGKDYKRRERRRRENGFHIRQGRPWFSGIRYTGV